jgi:3-hydroxyisobutyrate dehydrogenase
MTKVALLGQGIMGSGIAQNLLKAGFPLTVYNRTKARALPQLEKGAQWADTPAAAAAAADVVISVVGDDAASRAVWLGESGAVAGLQKGAIAIECSTVSLDWVRELHAQVTRRGFRFMEAPLMGSKLVAQAGTLSLAVGAEPATLEEVRPVLSAYASTLTLFGAPGAGTTYKLINNMVGGVHLAALGEAIALAERCGLNMETVLQAITSGAVASPMVKAKAERVITRQHTDTHFALQWMHKDLTYALRAADEAGVAMPTIAVARELFRLAMQAGLAEQDCAAVAEVVRGK